MGHDMELVEGDAGVGQVLGHTLDERRRHVDAHRFDLLGCGMVRAQMRGQLVDRLRVAAFGHEQHPALGRVGHRRQVVVAAPRRGLVDGQRPDFGQVKLSDGQLDVALADGVHPVPGFAHQAGHGGKRHLARQRQHQRLKQQRKAGQPPEPLRLDQRHLAVGQPHPWHPHLKVTVVLEEVQVPQPLGLGVVHRVLAGVRRMGKATAGGKVHSDGQPAGSGVEAHLLDRPRGRNPQRLLKQPFRARHRLPPRPSPLHRRTRPCSSVSSVVPRQGSGCARPAAALDPFSRRAYPRGIQKRR
jgi:leucyl-tRNA synthetase